LKRLFKASITANPSETATYARVPLEADWTSVPERTLNRKSLRRSKMNKSGFSYLKLTAVVAVLAVSLIGLSGLFSMTTMAQDEENETVKREVDLRQKLKDKKFNDGRRVEIHALATGEKITAEVKNGKFVNLFLVGSDGTEVKGVVRSAKTTNTEVCTATITTTTRERKGLHFVTITTTTIVQFPCLSVPGGATS
jgi:hypothetical protein